MSGGQQQIGDFICLLILKQIPHTYLKYLVVELLVELVAKGIQMEAQTVKYDKNNINRR
jgi:hypothetical protein